MDEVKITTVDAYIAQFPPDIQERLVAMRQVIREAAPDAAERISWEMPSYYLEGALVHFAAQKKHIGFYPAPSGVEAFAAQLIEYKTSKGGIQLPNSRPLPLALVREITEFRVAENKREAEAKKAKKKEKAL